MERSHYTFDKRRRYQREGRLRLFWCAAPDCRKVHHYPVKRGQIPKWCPGDRCRMRVRARMERRKRGIKPRRPRHKGVLGTAHWRF